MHFYQKSFQPHFKSNLITFNAGTMLLFWMLFDGIMTYIIPLVIAENGISKTMMGLIIGSSSVAGAIFDFLLVRFLKNTHYRRVYLLLFLVCLPYPLLVWQANSIGLFLIAMVFWGLFYDLQNFGNMDFVARTAPKSEHARSFSILWMFRGLGYLLAPILASILVVKSVGNGPFIYAWIFLGIAFLFYLFLVLSNWHSKEYIPKIHFKKIQTAAELKRWTILGLTILPFLFLNTLLNIFEAFIWTLGPLLTENFPNFRLYNGLFISAFFVAPLVVSWVVNKIATRFGKIPISFGTFIAACVGIILFSFAKEAVMALIVLFAASCLIAISWPTLKSIFADTVTRNPDKELEVEGLEDLFTNFGYIVGPLFAGILADNFGNMRAFSFLGILGGVVGILLYIATLARKRAAHAKNIS